MITHKWTREVQGNVLTSDADNDYAVYVSDNAFGIESSIQGSSLASDTYYVLRHKLSREHNLTSPIELYDV